MPRTMSLTVFALAALLLVPGLADADAPSAEYLAWREHRLTPSPPRRFDGPFNTDGMGFYFVHHGGPFEVECTVQADAPFTNAGYDRLFRNVFIARFFDAEENLAHWSYHEFREGEPLEKALRHDFGDAPPGIYQVRVAATMNSQLMVDVDSQPAASFGVLPLRTHLRSSSLEQFASAYFYIPPGAKEDIPGRALRAVGRQGHYVARMTNTTRGTLLDENGEVLLELQNNTTHQVPVERTGVVWQLQLPALRPVGHAHFGQAGAFDAILCPDEETARNIGGNVHLTPDGRAFPHRFQARMWEWTRNLTPEDLEVNPRRPMLELEDEWMGEPRRQWLLGGWGAFTQIPHVLREQTLDNPNWGYSMSGALAVAYTLDKPFNPYVGDPGIRNRLLLAEFTRWMRLRESGALMDTWHGHSGADSFAGTSFAYGLAAQSVEDEELRGLWTTGVRAMMDRFPHHRMSPENQSTHWLLNLLHLNEGIGTDQYAPVVENYARMLLDPEYNGPMRAGYLMESYGPDATYQGLSACHVGWYYRRTGDPLGKEALERIYALFNHTVGPEPDGGRPIGASHFSHRTPGSWAQRQYGGGTLMMADEMPGAAAWHQGYDASDPDLIEQVNAQLRDDLRTYYGEPGAEPPRGFSSYRYVTRYLYSPERALPDAAFPMVESERFDRDFDGQFYAVRRPAYYALVYAGKPDPRVQRIRRRDVPEGVQRRTGGGLSLFWTPGFGVGVVSANWNAYVNQMVRVDAADGKVDWPDYWSLEAEYDEEAGVLRSTSRLMHLPVEVIRTTTFADDALEQYVVLRADGNLPIRKAVEQLPFPMKASLMVGENGEERPNVWFLGEEGWTQTAPPRSRAAWLGAEGGEGVLVDFQRPTEVGWGAAPGAKGHRAAGQVAGEKRGMIEIRLDSQGTLYYETRLLYTLRPASWEDVQGMR